MIAYEIKLRYIIRGKIQFDAKSSPRKNLKKNFLLEKKFVRKQNCQKKIFVCDAVLDFQCAK